LRLVCWTTTTGRQVATLGQTSHPCLHGDIRTRGLAVSKALTRTDQRYPRVDRVVAKPTPGRVG
jgi:hypothetical protein